MLRGFADKNGRLTVVQVRPEVKIWTKVRPRYVGRADHLNSFLLDDGGFDDLLEREPLNRLDTAGSEGLRQIIEYAGRIVPEGAFRLWNREWEARVPFTMHTAGLLARGPGLREQLDEAALPALIEHMRDGIRAQKEAGAVDAELAKTLLDVLERPGGVQLTPPRNRHPIALMGLITALTAAIGSHFVVAVRRVASPLLVGSEPVVVFPTGDVREALSFPALLARSRPPVRLWDEESALHARLSEIVEDVAGFALAADRHTVAVFLNAEARLQQSGKLVLFFSEVSDEGLSAMLNFKLLGQSSWVAGAAGDPILEMAAAATPASAFSHRRASP